MRNLNLIRDFGEGGLGILTGVPLFCARERRALTSASEKGKKMEKRA